MHTAKCEMCEIEVRFRTYCRDWPAGWILTGRSRWGKKYHRKSGWGWWCPKCQGCSSSREFLRLWLTTLPVYLQDSILAHLPGLAVDF